MVSEPVRFQGWCTTCCESSIRGGADAQPGAGGGREQNLNVLVKRSQTRCETWLWVLTVLLYLGMGWGPWPGRQDWGELETSPAAGACGDWYGESGKRWGGWDEIWLAQVQLAVLRLYIPETSTPSVPLDRRWRKQWKAIAMVIAGAPGYTL